MRSFTTAGLFLVILIGLSDRFIQTSNGQRAAAKSLWDHLKEDKSVSWFHGVAKLTYMRRILQTRNMTIFVPTNSAYQKLSAKIKRLLRYNLYDLYYVILYHFIIDGVYPTRAMADGMMLPVGLDRRAFLNVRRIGKSKRDIWIQGKKLVTRDLHATNGVMHIIDGVMFPPKKKLMGLLDADRRSDIMKSVIQKANFVLPTGYTIFTPHNGAFNALTSKGLNSIQQNRRAARVFVAQHIIPRPIFMSSVVGNGSLSVKTLAGSVIMITQTSRGAVISIQGSDGNHFIEIDKSDLFLTNGVVHSVKQVLTADEALLKVKKTPVQPIAVVRYFPKSSTEIETNLKPGEEELNEPKKSTTAPATTQEQTTLPETTMEMTTATEAIEVPTTLPATTKEMTTAPATTEVPTTLPATTMEMTTATETIEVPTTLPATTKEITTAPTTTEVPTTLQATTKEMTTAPATTEEPTTLPVTTKEITTAQATTEEPTTLPATTKEMTTAPATTEEPTTLPATTKEMTTAPTTTEEPTTLPVTTKEITTAQATTEEPTTLPATTKEMTTAPATTEEPTTLPVTTKEITTAQATTEEPTTLPATTKEMTTAPATTEEPTTLPATTKEMTTAPTTTEEPTTLPVTTKEITTAQATTEEPTTLPATTKEMTTAPATTEEPTTLPVTTKEITTAQATTEEPTTLPATTKEMTTAPATTEEPTTLPATTKEMTIAPTTTEEPTTLPATTKEMTTAPATTQEQTTLPATTKEITTAQATTEEPTTLPATTKEMTTAPATTEEPTTLPATTKEMTTAPATTQEQTTLPATTEKMTTPPETTEEPTTLPATTKEITTAQATTEEPTTLPATTKEMTTAPATTEEATTLPATTKEMTTAPATTEEATASATTQEPVTPAASACYKNEIPFCKNIFNFTVFPNSFKHKNQKEAWLKIKKFIPLAKTRCSKHVRHFLCSLYTPPCIPGNDLKIIKPCRSLCLAVRDSCIQVLQDNIKLADAFECSTLPADSETECYEPLVNLQATLIRNGLTQFLKHVMEFEDLRPILTSSTEKFTIFAPRNGAFGNLNGNSKSFSADRSYRKQIMKYHIIPKEVKTKNLRFNEFKTLSGTPLVVRSFEKRRMADHAFILSHDKPATNGRLNIVDRLMVPNENHLANVLTNREQPSISIFRKAITMVGMLDILKKKTSTRYIVWVPTDEAFLKLSKATLEYIFRNQDVLRSMVNFHLTPGYFHTKLMTTRWVYVFRTRIPGVRLRVRKIGQGPRGLMVYNKAKRTARSVLLNLGATNGIVNLIDTVLFPPKLKFPAYAQY